MKRKLFRFFLSMLFISSLLTFVGCSKFDFTGTLIVKVYDPTEDKSIFVYPYEGSGKSIAEGVIEKGGERTLSFELNNGNYTVYCNTDFKSVQVQPGKEVTLTFLK